MLQAASMMRASSSSATVLMGQVEILTGYFFRRCNSRPLSNFAKAKPNLVIKQTNHARAVEHFKR
jgi:hypothetical protein